MIHSSYSRRQADGALLFVAAIWGTTFVAVKEALADLAPYNFLAIRFTLALIVLAVPGFCRGRRLRASSLWRGARLGTLLFAAYALQTVGLQYTTASNAAFITGLSVVLVPLLTAVGLRSLPAPESIGGALLAAVGLGCLTLGDGLVLNVGDLLVLGCAFAFAGHIVLIGKYAAQSSTYELVVGQMLAVALWAWLFTLIWEEPSLHATPRTWAAIVITGILASAVALSIQTTMQRFTSPTRTGIIFSTEPVFAALFAYLWLHETLSLKQLVGCVLILSGMLFTELWGRGEAGTKPTAALSPSSKDLA
ncbi:MAG: DMT family transporter [Firmicutes bacterium]|jgi:drug/metabolite transporter (DMT)-like permease|nr:DMT family transporter [Bacillota bacterium]